MLTNYHTHTNLCDGKNTPEEMVLSAIKKGFSAIGFSGHGYTPHDLSYCIKDIDEYTKEINRLKEKYAGKIQIYCGIEEDASSYVDREKFDYIIGSSHYFHVDGEYYPFDCSFDGFKKCLELFDYDVLKMAESYYSAFVDYIAERKPDIVGHFDLITKYDEVDVGRFLNNPDYIKVAEKYMRIAADNDVIFEVNTGAISRGYRKAPYPAENLLQILKEKDCKLILSSDSHQVDTLDTYFKETEKILCDIGFKFVYWLDGGVMKKRLL